MDLFTHALLPYLFGKVQNVKKEYLTALILGGIAPDFDVFIMGVSGIFPSLFIITHRGITHSFLFGLLTMMAVLYLASRQKIRNKIRKYVDFNPVFSRENIMFGYFGVVLHLFLDGVTTRGVPLFYPFEIARYSAEVFFYTDTFLMIVSLAIVVYIFKKPVQKHTAVKFLLIFLIAFAVMGGLRIVEKNDALDFFEGGGKQAFPTMNPFEWYVLSDGEIITTYQYNGMNSLSQYNETVQRLNVLSGGAGLDAALTTAGELPQVKSFKWRAHAVAINATFGNETWLLEYYDPLQRSEMRSAPAVLRRGFSRFSALNVSMKNGNASVV
ncbi:MAG: metal-dependent hydrolase [Candidatus Methanoperedens sp.]|jgi:inner membrane protein|nr:metal-dependent hydrolase [Candidatus Methanoperedens sp.]PKL54020.1 MAG: hypothetical protein CVV36_03955 [Candidatus Methanoperedenaceae archaeon HGW-Methanoperedenaceae-1]